MTLISSLITDAFREANILALGKEPTANQATEALRLFQQNIRSIYGSEAGEDLTDWSLGSYGREAGAFPNPPCLTHPPINSRLLATNTEAMTIYLTPYPQDGARFGVSNVFGRLSIAPITINANGRTVDGSETLLLNTDDAVYREWFYSAPNTDWAEITTLSADSECPFPEDFDAFFSIGLALRLNPRYGRTMDEQTALVFKQQRRQFIARYLQSRPLEIDDSISWPFMSRSGDNERRGFSSTTAFNRGYYEGR